MLSVQYFTGKFLADENGTSKADWHTIAFLLND